MSFNVKTPQAVPGNNKEQYRWFQAQGTRLSFTVKLRTDVCVALSSVDNYTGTTYEALIGHSNNANSVISENKNIICERQTPGLLNANEFRGFWIDWKDGILRWGRKGETRSMMMLEMRAQTSIKFFGILSNTPADWIIDKPTNIWLSATHGFVPEGALVGGEDSGMYVYVGRANHEGELVPGKVLASHNGIYIPFKGREVHLTNYEVFISHGAGVWIRTTGNNIPATAIVAGITASGENLFVGRVRHNGTLTPGKVHPSHRVCYISYDGKEVGFENYEVLIG